MITVIEPRTETREIFENAHFRGWHRIVQRTGQLMIAILYHGGHERQLTANAMGEIGVRQKDRTRARTG
jgi:hypothetical protein